jgi:AcrR family transcriptional regulator
VSRTATTTPRRGEKDWIAAAFALMAEDGIAGVKIQRLCDRLGVTKGSFYWHFDDLDAFLSEVATRWHDADRRGAARDPKALLLDASRRFARPGPRRLASAMRDWARTDPRARAAVRASDEALFTQLTRAFRALGFDASAADVRAKILFYAGVGFGDVGPIGDPASPERQLQTLIDLLTR